MKRFAGLAALSILATGCPGDCEEGDTSCETDSETGDCDNSVDETFPADGETAAYYRGTIEVKFDDREDDATFTVTDAGGTAVNGTFEWSGDTLVMTPSAALMPSTTYTIAIDYSCGNPTTTFTTSEVGGAVQNDAVLGNTYALALNSGRFVEPEGIGSILEDFIEQDVLIGVLSANPTEIEMVGAIAEEGSDPPGQAECDPTIPFPTADFASNPFFEIGPETTTLSVAGYTVTIDDLLISGSFAPDGSYIAGAVLAGTIDTRPLVPLLDSNADCSDDAPRCCDTDVDPECNPDNDVDGCCDEDQICDLAFQIGVECIACSGDNQNFCLSLYVDSMNAAIVDDLTLAQKHLPADDATAPPESTNICEIDACSAEEECAAQ
jgi:hypothetical protein